LFVEARSVLLSAASSAQHANFFVVRMRLSQGDNFVISERDRLAVCQIWVRSDLTTEQGAKNADDMVSYLANTVLCVGTSYRGVILDVRRGPPVWGPKTRAALTSLVSRSVERAVPLAILTGEAATQALLFRSLVKETPNMTRVFSDEPAAVGWLRTAARARR
jgi:hypothetical protein